MIAIGLLLLVVLVAAIAALLIARCFCLLEVRGSSMRPALEEGEWLLGRKWFPWERPRIGTVVIARSDPEGRLLVKRLAAVAGAANRADGVAPARLSPGDSYLLAGDSSPGLSIGPVPRPQLRALALLVIWPPRRLRRLRGGVGQRPQRGAC